VAHAEQKNGVHSDSYTAESIPTRAFSLL